MAQFTQTELKYLIQKLKELKADYYQKHEKGFIPKQHNRKLTEKDMWSLIHYGNYLNTEMLLEWVDSLQRPKSKPLPFVSKKRK
jgi:hypothetical protein